MRDIQAAINRIEEQYKIAGLLTAIDRKIEAVARQSDRTKQFKKGLLQRIFVRVVTVKRSKEINCDEYHPNPRTTKPHPSQNPNR